MPMVYLDGRLLRMDQMKVMEVYVRKGDLIEAALRLALEDLPALVRQLHSPEE